MFFFRHEQSAQAPSPECEYGQMVSFFYAGTTAFYASAWSAHGDLFMRILSTVLFEKTGPLNTDVCIQTVQRYLKEHAVQYVVVASTSGITARAFHAALKDMDVNLVIVTHSVGFKEPNHDEFNPEIRAELGASGVGICTGTILTHALEKSIMEKFGGSYPGSIIASTLRRFGEGTKVAVEIVMEACDAGLIPEDAEVLAAGGTGRGTYTILLIKSKPSKRFLDLEVLEILARPRGR